MNIVQIQKNPFFLSGWQTETEEFGLKQWRGPSGILSAATYLQEEHYYIYAVWFPDGDLMVAWTAHDLKSVKKKINDALKQIYDTYQMKGHSLSMTLYLHPELR